VHVASPTSAGPALTKVSASLAVHLAPPTAAYPRGAEPEGPKLARPEITLTAPDGKLREIPPVTSSLRPPPQAKTRKGGSRGKSQFEFIRMLKSNKNPTPGYVRGTPLTREEVAKHNKPWDCWMVLQGWVYDVSSYMEYHPGGKEELLRGAGLDSTVLFQEAHPWINIEGIIGALKLGRLQHSARADSARQLGAGPGDAEEDELDGAVAAEDELDIALPAATTVIATSIEDLD
jgi:cytochrome b involved in lipid metabolism